MALSRLGISVNDFMNITPLEFYYALQDRAEYDGLTVKAIIRPLVEVVRLHLFYTLNIHLPRGKKIRKPESLFRFDWERKKAQSLDEMKRVMKAIAHAFKKNEP